MFTKMNKNIVQNFSLDWAIGLFEVYKQLMCYPIVLPFFSSIWRMQNIWSVVDLLAKIHTDDHQ